MNTKEILNHKYLLNNLHLEESGYSLLNRNESLKFLNNEYFYKKVEVNNVANESFLIYVGLYNDGNHIIECKYLNISFIFRATYISELKRIEKNSPTIIEPIAKIVKLFNIQIPYPTRLGCLIKNNLSYKNSSSPELLIDIPSNIEINNRKYLPSFRQIRFLFDFHSKKILIRLLREDSSLVGMSLIKTSKELDIYLKNLQELPWMEII